MGRTIEEELEKQDYILLQTTGISMEPLLHNRRSSVVVQKAPPILKKYDVVLFRRVGSEEYVLHRVLKVRENDCLICGDNGIYKEPVPKDRILGIMTGYYSDENSELISCGDKEYQKYLRVFWIRYSIRWIRNLPGRIRRKLAKRENLVR